MHLLIGSEGTLGIITKAVIKLHPRSQFSATLIVPFSERRSAIQTVPKILRSGITPSAIEYIESAEIEKTEEHLGEKWPAEKAKSQLIVILNALDEDGLYSMCTQISEICQANGALEPMFAETREEQNKIVKIRSNVYTALKADVFDILDITVAPSKLGALMDLLDGIAEKYGTRIPLYGHAGDGNLHVHVMKENDVKLDYEKVKKEIYAASVSLGGVITGEHGIGSIRIKYLDLLLSQKEIELLRAIKRVFDPNNILNPGKVLPSLSDS